MANMQWWHHINIWAALKELFQMANTLTTQVERINTAVGKITQYDQAAAAYQKTVKDGLDALRAEIADLKTQLANSGSTVDTTDLDAALDNLDNAVAAEPTLDAPDTSDGSAPQAPPPTDSGDGSQNPPAA
jgi:hypothetical protein